MVYLTGASGGVNDAYIRDLNLGLMLQPGNGYLEMVYRFPFWAADNGCFAQGDRFDLDRFYTWLDRVPRARCLFAVAPDVYPDAAATLARSASILPVLRASGFRAAFVAQNGAETVTPPWDDLDCLFLGGTTAWKLGASARELVTEAQRRGKWVHMGRVNSERRLRYATIIGCDSSDGTFLKFGPTKNRPRLASWFRQAMLPYRRVEAHLL